MSYETELLLPPLSLQQHGGMYQEQENRFLEANRMTTHGHNDEKKKPTTIIYVIT